MLRPVTESYDQAELERVARGLLAHRDEGRPNPVPPPAQRPTDMGWAYGVAAQLHRIRAEERGWHQIGWKIGCTNAAARAQLGIDAPFYGRLYADTTLSSPADLPAGTGWFKVYEAEIALVIGRDLDPADGPFTADQLEDATRAILPVIEVVGCWHEPWTQAGAALIAADNAAHGYWITGTEVTDWSGLDLLDLPITVRVDGQVAGRGVPGNVDTGPFGVAAWLADTLAASGVALRAGDHISTGLTTPPIDPAPGQHAVADFGPLGQVEVRLAPA